MITWILHGGPLVAYLLLAFFLGLLALLAQQLLISRARLAGLGPAVVGGLLSLGVLGGAETFTMAFRAAQHSAPDRTPALIASALELGPITLKLAVLGIAVLSPLLIAARRRDRLGAWTRAERVTRGLALVSPAGAALALLGLAVAAGRFAAMDTGESSLIPPILAITSLFGLLSLLMSGAGALAAILGGVAGARARAGQGAGRADRGGPAAVGS